ncbi:hypothetical protein E8L99_04245 [Phreatobacter aquaticus]|uniref:Uncharacterized protein n=1 Tax=Phreatobacter aquaticus TaxID=2570229 RepID=A0A4D7QH86_9HYPH|nr:hypothetical protein [Phreatobacter aquaticus]QCK85043.1 hypothetical protein E8L99_04245 [Phreatobacter aquaticus]
MTFPAKLRRSPGKAKAAIRHRPPRIVAPRPAVPTVSMHGYQRFALTFAACWCFTLTLNGTSAEDFPGPMAFARSKTTTTKTKPTAKGGTAG